MADPTVVPAAADPRHARLGRAWATPPGLQGFFTAVNHRAVGLRFMITAFVFFLLAGALAVAMRLQLALPFGVVLSPDAYNQAFTMHGSTMMFLFVIPFLEGLAIYLVPLMIGARDMAFPRLNAFGYWVFLVAGVALYGAYLTGNGPDGGWYNYPPLTGRGFTPGVGIDFWVTMITFLEVSALVAAVELIVTILKLRAPGMSLNRMPLFVWAVLITAFMIVLAMPALILASLMLGLDRLAGTHFFNVAAGGDPLLWQHLFWFFGHPDVYIMLLPGVGAVSMIIPVVMRRPIAAYTLMVVSMTIIGLLSFGVWVHHMYTVGLALVGLNFFAAASMLFLIPSAIQLLAWGATIWYGARRFLSTAMLFSVGFIILFIAGGITGIMIAAVPLNWQVHDTQFIVAHFHYTLVGGAVLPIFAAVYFWFPKVTGRLLDERLGRWHFWLFLVGFNLTFLLMHLTGLEGMPRRVYTYMPGLGWEWLNMLSTAGTLVMGVASLVFVWNVYWSWRFGPVAGDDPWGGATLEWATTSPPQAWNFTETPLVWGRDPLWEEGSPGGGDGVEPPSGARDRPFWLVEPDDGPEGVRESVVTSVLAAEPQGWADLPGPTLWPFWLAMALSVAFLGVVWTPAFLPLGLVLSALALAAWHWPGAAPPPGSGPSEVGLPRQLTGLRSPLVWGVLMLLLIEATLAALFVVSHLYLEMGAAGALASGGAGEGSGLVPVVGQLLLLLSPLAAWWGLRRVAGGDSRGLAMGVAVGLLLAGGHLALKVLEYMAREERWNAHALASMEWTAAGYAALHVGALIFMGSFFLLLAVRGHFHRERYTGVQCLVIYWTFVALASLGLQLPALLGRAG